MIKTLLPVQGTWVLPGQGTRSILHATTEVSHAKAKRFPHAATKILCAATKTQHSQIKEKKKRDCSILPLG